MKISLFPSFYLFFLLTGLFAFSSQIICGQKSENQNKIIRFVNRHDEVGGLSRPRISGSSVNSSTSGYKSSTTVGTGKSAAAGFERSVFDLINRKRAEAGLKILVWNDDAAKIARMHSENMANYTFFDHAGRDGKMVNNRADAVGLTKWRSIGENIAYNRGYATPLEFVVESWMKSVGHRTNILNNGWQETGIGIAVTTDGTYYFTQVFLLRK